MAVREIIFDTETTGLDPATGDRIVEIGCVELLNQTPTGRSFHYYIDPERDVPDEAFQVHGLSTEFLRGKPVFAAIVEEFRAFIGDDARLVAHNAEFDIRFINAEFSRLGHPPIAFDRVTDTLALARRKHPGAPNSLDALCARYRIDSSKRTKHGALLDAELLADVYLELLGGRQAILALVETARTTVALAPVDLITQRPQPLARTLVVGDVEAHDALVRALGEQAIWRSFLSSAAAE